VVPHRDRELTAYHTDDFDERVTRPTLGVPDLALGADPAQCGRCATRTAKSRQARAEAIADRGNRLISHIVFQHLDLDGIDDPDTD
jgi:hypothetical protein